MATAVATKASAPHPKMKRPPPPSVQTNGVYSHQSSPSPSLSSKRPASGFNQPPPTPTINGVNGNSVNAMSSRVSNRRRESQKPGDIRPNRNGKPDGERRIPKRMSEPYVKTQSYILKKYRKQSPSLIIHLHPTHFRFDQQDGSFSYNSPMKFVLEHLKSQTVPHDMVEELQIAGVKFYESCLIVQVQDHRSSSSTLATSKTTSKHDTNVPFSIHNYNEHLTPSPYVPFLPQDEDASANGDTSVSFQQAELTNSKEKQNSAGPKTFTVVLFPTPLSLQEEVFIQANTPDPRPNRKQSAQVPRTPVSTTIPPTPVSAIPSTPSTSGPPNKKQKMSISGAEVHGFESMAIMTTAPPLFLEPVDNIEDAHRVLESLTDSRHKERHPLPKTRKRTVAELAADEAIAAQEEAFMLIMDERHGVCGPAGVKAVTTDTEAGTAAFEPRFETWQAIKNIKALRKERAEKEAEDKARKEAESAAKKLKAEEQERAKLLDTQRRAHLLAQDQQRVHTQQRQEAQLHQVQMREAAHREQQAQMAAQQRQQALNASQNQLHNQLQANLAHGHPMPHGISQAQVSSPIVRNVTPNTHSSPLSGNLPMNVTSSGQGNTSSPARPGSAMQHGHPGPVAMTHQRSRQPSSRTTTPLVNGTPVTGHATPRMSQGSPPMIPTPTMNHNGMVMNGQPQYTPAQLEMIRRQQHEKQAAIHAYNVQRLQQSGSPNPQLPTPQQQVTHNAQRQREYMQSLQAHHGQMQMGNNGLPNMSNGSSPHPHPQQARLPQQQSTPQQRPNVNFQQREVQQHASAYYNKIMGSLLQRHGGNQASIPPSEIQQAKSQAMQFGQQAYHARQKAAQRQAMQLQQHAQQMGQGMPSGMNLNGQIVPGGGMTEQQRQHQQAVMQQMAQLTHMGGQGQGMQSVNGTGHNPHMNGGMGMQ